MVVNDYEVQLRKTGTPCLRCKIGGQGIFLLKPGDP